MDLASVDANPTSTNVTRRDLSLKCHRDWIQSLKICANHECAFRSYIRFLRHRVKSNLVSKHAMKANTNDKRDKESEQINLLNLKDEKLSFH